MKTPACVVFFLLLAAFHLHARAWYFSPYGNDKADGKSPETAWRSIERANNLDLEPGDSLLFEGGGVFKGNLLLDRHDAGAPGKPVLVDSYGRGKALIDAGDGFGVRLHNAGNIVVRRINVKGSGVGNNRASGIDIWVSDSSLQVSGIRIDYCTVSGFRLYGICLRGTDAPRCGASDVRIENCEASENGEAGIGSYCWYPAIAHRNVFVGYCKAFSNRGIPEKTDNHSGNGIVMSGVEDLYIVSSEAYGNGADNRSQGGGPVGIWLWNCRRGIIEHCLSHDNYAGLHCDGGGFDLDGGASDCEIRYCKSYSNEGAGYLVCEFGSPLPFTNNIVSNNYSSHDGLKNNYGGITIAGASDQYRVNNTIIRNNVILVSSENVVNGTPCGIRFVNNFCSNIRFENNFFTTIDSTHLLHVDTFPTAEQAVFFNNTFQLTDSSQAFFCNNCTQTQPERWLQILAGQRDSGVEHARSFIATLSAAQQAKTLYPFGDMSRFEWHYLPALSAPRTGLALADLNNWQKTAAYTLMRTFLSEKGYDKAQRVMRLEYILKQLEPDNPARIPEDYYMAIYGTPHPDSTWGWKLSGHHLALNFTVVKGQTAFAPFFYGSNPGEVLSGENKGMRVLKDEEDLGFDLLRALDAAQQQQAIFSDKTGFDVLSKNAARVDPFEPAGIPARALNPAQKDLLNRLIAVYLDNMPPDLAQARAQRIATEDIDAICFGWAGATEYGLPHYYRVQGKTFLIEFDNSQNNANHIHTVWRDFNGDFGRDVLLEHYRNTKH